MFLNFPLPLMFRAFSGIDLTPFKEVLGSGHISSKDFQLRWERCCGWASGLAHSTQFGSTTGMKNLLEETGERNPILCVGMKMRPNLPGDAALNPTLPRVMK
jgi:hypothetical protein